MNKILFCLATLGIAACSSPASIKDQPDTVKLSARVTRVVLPVSHFPDSEISYVPVNGVVVPVPKSPRPMPAFADDYRYTLAVAGHGEIETKSSHQFSLGQCVLLYLKGGAGKIDLSVDIALIEASVHPAEDCDDVPSGRVK